MQNKKVLVAGCGALGCYNVEYMARLGVGKIVVVDGDSFSESNINRQLYCLNSNLGTAKVVAAKERWGDQVIAFHKFINEDNVGAYLTGCNLAIDALDNVKTRKLLADACEKMNIPMVHGAVGDLNSQVCAIFPGDKDILDILYSKKLNEKSDTVSYIPAYCASLQSSLAHRILNGENIERRTLYISDLSTMTFEKIKL